MSDIIISIATKNVNVLTCKTCSPPTPYSGSKIMIGMIKNMKKFFSLILCTLLLLSGCQAKNDDWVINIDNNKVSKPEFLVYLQEQKRSFEQQGGEDIWETDFDGVSAWEVAKQNAANSVVMVKLAVAQADSLGVSDATNAQEVSEDAKELYDSFTQEEITSMGITPELTEDIIAEGQIQSRVFEAVTKGYRPNEEEFDKYCRQYYEDNIDMYKQISLRSIYIAKEPSGEPMKEVIAIDEFNNRPKKNITTTGKAKADEAYEMLKNGESFNSVQYDYSEDPNRLEFLLTSDMYNEDILNVIYALKKDEYTPVLEYEDGYYIFCAKEVSETPIDSVKEELSKTFEDTKKREIYQEQNERWYSEANITRNTEVWDSITIQ